MKRTIRLFTAVFLAAFAMPDEAASQQFPREASAYAPAGAAYSALGYSQQGDADIRAAKRVMDEGDFREAARMFARVAERYPRTSQAAEALYFQAFALYRTGNSSSLSNALEALRDLDRQYPTSSFNRGDAGPLRSGSATNSLAVATKHARGKSCRVRKVSRTRHPGRHHRRRASRIALRRTMRTTSASWRSTRSST